MRRRIELSLLFCLCLWALPTAAWALATQPTQAAKNPAQTKKKLTKEGLPSLQLHIFDDAKVEKGAPTLLAQRRYYRRRRYRRGPRGLALSLLFSGIAVTASSYGVSLLTGLIGYAGATAVGDGRTAFDFGLLMIPVIGPWATWAVIGAQGLAPITYPFLGLLGVAQLTGVTLIIIGAVLLGQRRRVYYGDKDGHEEIKPTWAISPYVNAQGAGVNAFAAF